MMNVSRDEKRHMFLHESIITGRDSLRQAGGKSIDDGKAIYQF